MTTNRVNIYWNQSCFVNALKHTLVHKHTHLGRKDVHKRSFSTSKRDSNQTCGKCHPQWSLWKCQHSCRQEPLRPLSTVAGFCSIPPPALRMTSLRTDHLVSMTAMHMASQQTLIQSSSRGYIMCCYTVTSTWGWGSGGHCGHKNSELLTVLSLKERLCQKIAYCQEFSL